MSSSDLYLLIAILIFGFVAVFIIFRIVSFEKKYQLLEDWPACPKCGKFFMLKIEFHQPITWKPGLKLEKIKDKTRTYVPTCDCKLDKKQQGD